MLRLVIWLSMMLLGWGETNLRTLKYGSKSIQTSAILRHRHPKPYKLFKIFVISLVHFKVGKHSGIHLSIFQIVGAWRDFTVVTKLIKNFRSLYGFGGRCLKITDVCMDFEPYFKVHNSVSVHPKIVQMERLAKVAKFHTNPYNFVAYLPNPYKLSILGNIWRATIPRGKDSQI